jgi:hypothetical protein
MRFFVDAVRHRSFLANRSPLDLNGGESGIGIEEAVVATLVSKRPSTFRINCVQCKAELIVPEKSESCDGKHIRHLRLCQKCETSFESLESIPVEAMTTDDIFPSTIVAQLEPLEPLERPHFAASLSRVV